MAREITYNNFEISFVVFMPNITTNHAITYTKTLVNTVTARKYGKRTDFKNPNSGIFYNFTQLIRPLIRN